MARGGQHPQPSGVGLRTSGPDRRGPPRHARAATSATRDGLAPLDPGATRSLRRLDGNDYSVHPGVIGRRIEVVADLARVRVLCDGKTVADHERVWAKHQTISDPEHVAAGKLARRERLRVVRPATDTDVEIRALSDYDAALGIDGTVA